MIKTNWYRNR